MSSPRQQIYSGHRVRGSSAPVAWINRSIERGQQAGFDRHARLPATVRRLSGSPGRAQPVWSTPAVMGGVPRAAAPQQSEERQQGAQRSGRPLAPIPARRSLRSVYHFSTRGLHSGAGVTGVLRSKQKVPTAGSKELRGGEVECFKHGYIVSHQRVLKWKPEKDQRCGRSALCPSERGRSHDM
ncbi:hypothetical protein NDU88_006485 [Pleurodeles waltl]|uniref:Uncharacterized protein n=1 Tax=Pleurodeles waltl TaxID=8319 RepID=A0AAV7LQZ6_PLEWA|nr:hypothetical protein NDU88_006485 [Pleurodeles waltl]